MQLKTVLACRLLGSGNSYIIIVIRYAVTDYRGRHQASRLF